MLGTSIDIKYPGLNVLPPGVERHVVNGGGLTAFQIFPDDELEIINDELLVLESATLYDINGRILWTRNDLGGDSRYAYPTGLLADGIYILRLQTKDGAVKTEKIRVFNK